jgi:hypothetical protein
MLLVAVVAAADGDVDATARALEACMREWNFAGRFYSDPDLGPALQDPRFKALREKYPPPPPQPGRDAF